MRQRLFLLVGSMTLFAAPAAAQCQFEDDVVTGAGTGGFSGPALFGTDVRVRGEIAVVGAPQSPGTGSTPMGYSRVYRRQSGGWTMVQQLAPTDALTGTAVDFDGRHLVVGAPGITSGGVDIFEHNGTEWALEQQLSVPGEAFGKALAVQNDWLAVQAPGALFEPRVYLYQKLSNGNWVLSEFLKGAGGAGSFATFGQSLAIGRGVLFIANPRKGSGAVEIYQLQGDQWSFLQSLTSPDPSACDFGMELAFDRGTLVVSERCTDTVRFFEKIGGTWTQVDSFAVPTVGGSTTFPTTGIRVDIFGPHTVVGVNEPGEQGRVFLLREDQTGWGLETELCMSAPTGSDSSFGNTVSITRSHVLVGHRSYQTDGGAFFYSLSSAAFEPGITTPLRE